MTLVRNIPVYRKKIPATLTTRRLSKNGDLIPVAAEVTNIVSNPFDAEALVSQASILRTLRLEGIRLCKSKN